MDDNELSPETESAMRAVEADMSAALDVPESWERINLAAVFSGEIARSTPELLRRDDGKGLFYTNNVNGVHGDSGDGKSFVMLIASVQEMDAGHHVIWIDFEDDPTTIADRLDDLGMDIDIAIERFHYHRPIEPFNVGAVQKIINEALKHDVRLIVIDSLGEAFGLEGVNEDRDNEVGPWLRRVARALAEVSAPAAVDHSTKAGDNPLFPSGSKRKRAAITGASYLVRAVIPLTRERGGKLHLICAKDRHGHYKRGDVAAVIDFHRYEDGGLSVKVWPPDDDADNPQKRLWWTAKAAVDAVQEAGRPLTTRELRERMRVKARQQLKDAAIDYAVGEGALKVEDGPKNARLHVFVKALPEPGTGDDF